MLNKKIGKLDYVIDSVVSVIVWLIGVKIYNGVLGVDIYEKDYLTILEMVKVVGLAIGNVFIVEL